MTLEKVCEIAIISPFIIVFSGGERSPAGPVRASEGIHRVDGHPVHSRSSVPIASEQFGADLLVSAVVEVIKLDVGVRSESVLPLGHLDLHHVVAVLVLDEDAVLDIKPVSWNENDFVSTSRFALEAVRCIGSESASLDCENSSSVDRSAVRIDRVENWSAVAADFRIVDIFVASSDEEAALVVGADLVTLSDVVRTFRKIRRAGDLSFEPFRSIDRMRHATLNGPCSLPLGRQNQAGRLNETAFVMARNEALRLVVDGDEMERA